MDKGNISDGYHTFNELYEHRHMLFAYACKDNPLAWKARKHDDGSMFDGGWFIAGIDLKCGTITYHIPEKHWELFDCRELEYAPAWDGHTADDVIVRLRNACKSM